MGTVNPGGSIIGGSSVHGAYVLLGTDQTQNFQPIATLNWQGTVVYDTDSIFDTVGKQNFVIPPGFKYARCGAQVDTNSLADSTHTWVASTAYAIDDVVVPTAGSYYRYKCTTAGITGAAEPVWPLIIGSTVADGTAVWTCIDAGGIKARIQLNNEGYGRGTDGQKLNNFKSAHITCNPNSGWVPVVAGDTFKCAVFCDVGVPITVVAQFTFFWIELGN